MKLIGIFLVVFLSFIEAQTSKKGLVILSFKEKGVFPKKDKDIGSAVSGLIFGKIDMQQYEIIDQANIPEAVKARLFNEGQGIVGQDKILLIGMKIDHILVGEIACISGKYYGSYRIIDVRTGAAMKTRNGRYMKDAIRRGMPDFDTYVQKLFESLIKVGFMQEEPGIAQAVSVPTTDQSSQMMKCDSCVNGKVRCGLCSNGYPKCSICGGTGSYCSECMNKRKIDCPKCDGDGELGECSVCNGTGYNHRLGRECRICINGYKKCLKCISDPGKRPCPKYCDIDRPVCWSCKGICFQCKGTAQITCSKCQGKGVLTTK